jgi:hypothetical protein
MALVRKLDLKQLETDTPHTEADCTYSIVITRDGGKQLQLDTYGSSTRKLKGKKSQSIRLSAEAIGQLKSILAKQFG